MANITTGQEQNARKKAKVPAKKPVAIENSVKELSVEEALFPGVNPFGWLSGDAMAFLRHAEIKKGILSSSDLSEILKNKASSEHSISNQSPLHSAQYDEMDIEFDKAVVAITSAADTASRMTLELGEDLARIAAMRERIDRQNADNAKALKALLQGA